MNPVRTRCPLCGGDNQCGMESGGAGCWCRDVTFTPELLARVPLQARDQICVCRKCAETAVTSPRRS